MRDFWRAIKFASINKKLTFFTVCSSLLVVAMELIQPLIFKQLMDLIELNLKNGTVGTVPSAFWTLFVFFAVVTVGQHFAGQLSFYLTVVWYNKTRETLSKIVFAHLESLSLSYFESNSTGKIKERIDKGIWELVDIMESALLDIAPQFIFIIVAASILFSVNRTFGIILMSSIPIFIFISMRYSKQLIAIQDSVRDSMEKLSGMMTESIINIKTIKSYATEDRQYRKFSKQLLDGVIKDISYFVKRIFMNFFRIITMDFAQLSILGLGIYWTLTGKITLGTFTLAWQYTNRSMQPLWQLTRQIDNIQRKMRSVKRVFELIDTKPEINDLPDAKNLRIRGGAITFEQVTFSYKDKTVLKNLSLNVPAGKVLAIVGKSGSGKSTLIKLLSRFYEQNSGSISIDGQDITKITQRSLRKNIGVVLQDSILFNDSAANNIAYGRPTAKQSEIISAAKAANAHSFITKLPEGYQTLVGERGVKLSGGEQQRINIARAILKNPPILVLDEATSSLDSESEQLIQTALWKLIDGRTTIIIAHRLSTVMKADLIVVMDKGRIVEQGTHKDLVLHKGIYAKLFEIQSGGYLK